MLHTFSAQQTETPSSMDSEVFKMYNKKFKSAYNDSKKFANKHPLVALVLVGATGYAASNAYFIRTQGMSMVGDKLLTNKR